MLISININSTHSNLRSGFICDLWGKKKEDQTNQARRSAKLKNPKNEKSVFQKNVSLSEQIFQYLFYISLYLFFS